MRGFLPVLRKETLHMLRDRGTLRFAIAVPIFQLVLFGLIDTNVQHLPTAVVDLSRTAESRELVRAFVNTATFDVEGEVPSRTALHEEIVAGRAEVGIEIPPDYARRRQRGEPAHVLVLINGADSSVSSQALAAASGLALRQSVEELLGRAGLARPPLEAHGLLLFNPDSRSANLLIPGLFAILLMFSGAVLAAGTIVRERERGTLEQLLVTPVSPFGVILGKLVPYLVLGMLQTLLMLALMGAVFRVPVHGSVPLLLALTLVYLLALLSLGLLISSWAWSQVEATQIAMMFLLPSVMLSGYIFPLSSLPGPLRVAAHILPATHFVKIARGIIIRGAGIDELWPQVLALLAIACILLLGSTRAFRKTVS